MRDSRSRWPLPSRLRLPATDALPHAGSWRLQVAAICPAGHQPMALVLVAARWAGDQQGRSRQLELAPWAAGHCLFAGTSQASAVAIPAPILPLGSILDDLP